MDRRRQRLAGGAGVILAALIGLVTNIVTGHWSWALGVTLVVLVIAAVIVQVWTTGGTPDRVIASGPAAVGVGGTVHGEIRTDVVAAPTTTPRASDDADGVVASGEGSAAVGGDVGDGVNIRFRPGQP